MLILVFLTLIIITALGLYSWSEQKKQRQHVLGLIGVRQAQSKDEKGKGRSSKTPTAKLSQKDIAKKLESLSADDEKSKDTLKTLIAQTGMKISIKSYWIGSVIFACLTTLIGYSLNLAPLLLVLIFALSLFLMPKLFLKMKAGKRQKLFLKDFADALEAMVRLLKAGMPVSEAIAMVAKEFDGPVREEMEQIYEAQKIGVSLPDATLAAARRMPIPEMNMLATGVSIQQQTGSSLSEALSNLANLIRARHRLKRKVVALSSEATISAGIIGSLPIFVGGMLYLINPEYTGLLFTDPLGKVLSTGAVIWMCIGIFIMKQMINFKV